MYIASRTLLQLQACPQPAMHMYRLCDKRSLQSPVTQSKHVPGRLMPRLHPHWHRCSQTGPLIITCVGTNRTYKLLVPLAGTPYNSHSKEPLHVVKPNEAYSAAPMKYSNATPARAKDKTIPQIVLCVQVLGGHPPGYRAREGAFPCTYDVCASTSCGVRCDHLRCIVVRGDAWPVLLSSCNTHRTSQPVEGAGATRRTV